MDQDEGANLRDLTVAVDWDEFSCTKCVPAPRFEIKRTVTEYPSGRRWLWNSEE